MDKLMSLTGLKKVKARPKRLNNFHRVWLGLGILMDCGCQCAFLICSSGCRAGKFLFFATVWWRGDCCGTVQVGSTVSADESRNPKGKKSDASQMENMSISQAAFPLSTFEAL
jgi:hypothetical protein